jgi:hypothetical protein
MSSFAPAARFAATALAVLIGPAALTRAGRARDRPVPCGGATLSMATPLSSSSDEAKGASKTRSVTTLWTTT